MQLELAIIFCTCEPISCFMQFHATSCAINIVTMSACITICMHEHVSVISNYYFEKVNISIQAVEIQEGPSSFT